MVATPQDQARTALADLPQTTRLLLVTEVLRDITDPRLIAALERVATMAKATRDELAVNVANGQVPSDIDPTFMDVFIDFYDRVERPGLPICYQAAIKFVAHHRINCSAPTYGRITTAVARMTFPNRDAKSLAEA